MHLRSVIFLDAAVIITLFCYGTQAQWSGRSNECRRTKVAVLGAGVAGITAAQALSDRGIDDFLILESNSEIGGRCKNVKFGEDDEGGSYTVELGANWVQGTGSNSGLENPIWTLAKKYGIKNHISNTESILTYDDSGPNDFTNALKHFRNSFQAVTGDVRNQPDNHEITENVQELLQEAGWSSQEDAQKQAVEWYNFDYEYAQSPMHSSAQHTIRNFNSTFNNFSPDINFVTDQRGFSTFLKGQASEFLTQKDPRLLLSTAVQKITRTANEITIHNSDRTCIIANYAIMTFSIGVLQNRAISFSPPLPKWKMNAIDGMQMGTFTKIYMQFPKDKIFWDEKKEFFLFASNHSRGYFPIFQNFLPRSGILVATVVAEQARIVENQTERETKRQVLEVLRKMFGDTVPDPVDFMVPRWGSTPWAYGSFSNWPAGYTDEDHLDLQANIGRVWFAGEATSRNYYGYLQGAYFEGKRVGDLVADSVIDPELVGGVEQEYLMPRTPEMEMEIRRTNLEMAADS